GWYRDSKKKSVPALRLPDTSAVVDRRENQLILYQPFFYPLTAGKCPYPYRRAFDRARAVPRSCAGSHLAPLQWLAHRSGGSHQGTGSQPRDNDCAAPAQSPRPHEYGHSPDLTLGIKLSYHQLPFHLQQRTVNLTDMTFKIEKNAKAFLTIPTCIFNHFRV